MPKPSMRGRPVRTNSIVDYFDHEAAARTSGNVVALIPQIIDGDLEPVTTRARVVEDLESLVPGHVLDLDLVVDGNLLVRHDWKDSALLLRWFALNVPAEATDAQAKTDQTRKLVCEHDGVSLGVDSRSRCPSKENIEALSTPPPRMTGLGISLAHPVHPRPPCPPATVSLGWLGWDPATPRRDGNRPSHVQTHGGVAEPNAIRSRPRDADASRHPSPDRPTAPSTHYTK